MAFINYARKRVAVKIVYYGPGLSGKTTNLRYIFSKIDPRSRGDFICLETDAERTYFFDLLPIKAGLIGDFQVHFSLMTVPGQVFYEASRRSVLKGVDGIVFVADSQAPLLDSNLDSFDGMRKNLMIYNLDLNTIPLVFQYNKRDLDNLIPLETFNNLLNPNTRPYVEASAINGVGVFESLKEIAKATTPVVKATILEEKKVAADAATKSEVEFVSKEKKSPFQMTKLKLDTQDEVAEQVEKLTKEAVVNENKS
jgi:signal recognition particle receptor subunit beta